MPKVAATKEARTTCAQPCFAARLALCCAAITFSGCSTPVLISSGVGNTDSSSMPRSGLAYALPKAQVQLELIRSKVDPDALKKAKKAAVAAQAGLEAASKDRDEAEAAAQEAASIAKYANGEGRTQALALSDMARARLQLRESELAAAKLAKQRADADLLTAAEQPSDLEQSATLTLLPPVPDPEHRYLVQLDRLAPTRDQNIKLGLSNGLLHSTNASSNGQFASIMVSLTSAAAGLPVALAGASTEPKAKDHPPKPCEPKRERRVFDPTDPSAVAKIAEFLKTSFDDAFVLESSSVSKPKPAARAQHSVDGLVYRAPMPITVSVLNNPNGASCSGRLQSTGVVLSAKVPDAGSQFVLPVDANAFTTAKTDIVFVDGMPQSFASEQPSQLAAIARIPVNMLKALIEVPTELIKLRVDYSSQKGSLTDKEAAELKAKLALLEAEQALKDKQASLPSTSTSSAPR